MAEIANPVFHAEKRALEADVRGVILPDIAVPNARKTLGRNIARLVYQNRLSAISDLMTSLGIDSVIH